MAENRRFPESISEEETVLAAAEVERIAGERAAADASDAEAANRAAAFEIERREQLVADATTAKAVADLVADRCNETNLQIPSAWMEYGAVLDRLIGGADEALPARPAYPPEFMTCNVNGLDVLMTTEEEANLRLHWSENETALVRAEAQATAKVELAASDLVALRCIKAGQLFPTEWQTYCGALREVVRGNIDTLPARPEYPAGT